MASYRSHSYGFNHWEDASGDLNVTMTEPSGAAAGDTLVVIIYSIHGLGAPSVTLPSGWTQIYNDIDGSLNPRVTIGWVRRGSSAPSLTYTVSRTTSSDGYAEHILIAVQSGGSCTTPSTSSLTSSRTHTAPSVTASFDSSLLISWVGTGNVSSAPSGMTRLGSTLVAYQSVNAGATGTRAWTLTGSTYTRAGAFIVHDAPSISPSVSYPSGATRTGPNATPWTLSGSITAVNRVQLRTAANGGGTLIAESAVTPPTMAVDVAYNASGLVQGTNTIYLRYSQDGGTTWLDHSSTLTVLRDDSVNAPSSITVQPPPPLGRSYSVTFNGSDTYSVSANEMLWQIRTAAGGGGTLIAASAYTQSASATTGQLTDAELIHGTNTRWLRIRDGALNWAETSFTVTGDFIPREDLEEWRRSMARRRRRAAERRRYAVAAAQAAQADAEVPYRMVLVAPELLWRVGGVVGLVTELLWRSGGRRSIEVALRWRVYPSEQVIESALRADSGSVSYGYRAILRRPDGTVYDITGGVMGAVVEFNINRAVKRSLRLTVNPRLCGDVDLARLGDVVELTYLVDVGGFEVAYPLGRYVMEVPDIHRLPDMQTWTLAGADDSIRLMQSVTTTAYTIAQGAPLIDAVATILADHDIPAVLPQSSSTASAARTWPAGTPWLEIVNDLLEAAGLRSLWVDAAGIARSDRLELLAERTPDVVYDTRWIVPPTRVSYNLSRTANRVVVVSSNPAAPIVSASADNDTPESLIAISRIGRVIAKVVQADVASTTAAQERARYELQLAAAYYQTMEMETLVDPRRDGPEVYEVDVPCRDSSGRWALQSWVIDIGEATRMVHSLGRVQRV